MISLRLMGKEEEELSKCCAFTEGAIAPQTGGEGGGGLPAPSTQSPAQSAVNQSGLPQPSGEASAVGGAL